MIVHLRFDVCGAAIVAAMLTGAAAAQTPPPEPPLAQAPDPQTQPPPPPTDDEATGFGDIVVTAQRRSEALQDVPAAITAIGAAEIQTARIDGALDLNKIAPSVNVSTYFGAVQINIRGLGLTSPNPNGEPSVLTYVDGVFVARPTGIGAAFDDLERIEVLRGPQGTLYGRNATGGVVNLITRAPGDTFAGNIAATYGRFDRVKLTGGVEGPIAPGTSARIAGYFETRNGDMTNVVTGKKIRDFDGVGARGTVVSELSPTVTATLRGDYYKDDVEGVNFDMIAGSDSAFANALGSRPSNPSGFFPAGTAGPASGPLLNDGRRVRFDTTNPAQGHENYGGSLTLDWDIADAFSLKSISAYRDYLFTRDRQDYDGTDAQIIEERFARERSKVFTQELIASGETGGGIDYVLGGYYFNESTDLDYLYLVPSLATLINVAQGLPPGTVPSTFAFDQTGKTTSVSVFAQATVPITDRLKVTGGIRQNWDKKRQDQNILIFGADSCGGTARASGKWNDLTWKAGADYQVTDQNMFYATASKGFKAGGLNLSACFATYDPERVIAYEVGTKNTFLDGKLLLNLSAFYYDYTNLQVSVYTATTVVTENSSAAKVFGFEFESKLNPVQNLQLAANFSLLSTEYDGYFSVNPLQQAAPNAAPQNLSGNAFANAPKFLTQGSIDYAIPMGENEVKLRYDVRHNSGFFGDAFQNFGSKQNAYTVMNARASYKFRDFEVGGFVDNFTNEIYAENRFTFGTSANVIAIWAQRRTWGLFANAKF